MRSALLLAAILFSACATSGPRYEPVDEVIAWQGVPLEVSQQMPALDGSLRAAPAFQFICGTGALRVEPSSGVKTYKSITVWNAACSAGVCTPSATPVFLGGAYTAAGAATAVTNSTGMPICSSSGCIAPFASYDVENLQCIAGSSVTVTVQVVR